MEFQRFPRGGATFKFGVRIAALAAFAVLAACGGGGDDADTLGATPPSNPPANPPANPPGNQTPTISGTPQSQVMQGTAYSFVPSASDPDGNPLTFTITNKPSWATFSTSNGSLTGTPSSGDVGSYQNIQISVSDGTAGANLTTFSVSVVATASGSATLTWTPPNQNVDGSALTDLNGYRIYWGTSQGSYPNSVDVGANLTSYVVTQLTPATYYFVVTALNHAGTESSYSNVASKAL